MFTRSDLTTLIDAAPDHGVSIYLPTHRAGKETLQDPVRFRELLDESREKLRGAGMTAAEADALLAPADDLVSDYEFWQHQNEGLAVFLGPDGLREYRVPLAFEPQTHVGPEFHVKPLLPLLAADGSFYVLTVTADEAHLYEATRHNLSEDTGVEFPSVGETRGKNDYQSPMQGSPASRPHTGSPIAARTQAYGITPPEWRKAGLEQYAGEVAKAVERRIADTRYPVVLVADAELAGHVRKNSKLAARLAGVLETNPAAASTSDLHDQAYDIVRPSFESERGAALDRAAELIGQGSAKVATAIGDIVRSSYNGRVDTLLLADDATVPGRYDLPSDTLFMADDPAHPDADLTEAAAVRTLSDDGTVYIVEHERMAHLFDGVKDSGATRPPEFAAILRY
ncbi:hypothetical protein [Nocardia sp. NPDC050406]|uniref:baeRF3 domain-containing protein n=1 Tax=Nocardia sp. NPDC050406 TaxID=3364318 RepID=UPI0037939763